MTLELGVRHSWLERFPRRRLREPSRRGRVCPGKCHTGFAGLPPLHASARRSTWRQSFFERRRIWHDEELSLDQIPSVGPYPSLLVLNYAMYPPSIVRLAPVMNPASSDARYETKPAISHPSAIRASGTKVFTASA